MEKEFVCSACGHKAMSEEKPVSCPECGASDTMEEKTAPGADTEGQEATKEGENA